MTLIQRIAETVRSLVEDVSEGVGSEGAPEQAREQMADVAETLPEEVPDNPFEAVSEVTKGTEEPPSRSNPEIAQRSNRPEGLDGDRRQSVTGEETMPNKDSPYVGDKPDLRRPREARESHESRRGDTGLPTERSVEDPGQQRRAGGSERENSEELPEEASDTARDARSSGGRGPF